MAAPPSGATVPAVESSARTVVDVPAQTVWDVLVDHEGMASWGPSVGPGICVVLERAGDEERHGVGAVRRIVTPGPGPDVVEEIVVCQPTRVLGYRALGGVPFRGYRGEVVLHPRGTGSTEIVWTLYADRRLPGEGLALKALATGMVKALGGACRAAARG